MRKLFFTFILVNMGSDFQMKGMKADRHLGWDAFCLT